MDEPVENREGYGIPVKGGAIFRDVLMA